MKKLSFIFLMLFSITLFANNSNPLVKKDLNPEKNLDSIEIIDSTKILDPTEDCDCQLEITEKDGYWQVSCYATAFNTITKEYHKVNSIGTGETKEEATQRCYSNALFWLNLLIE
ncbi:hypothetical protein [Winogradskyella immobilis]|uniref:Uncharacterized protein n=1 Tax=Winogradskyella immobilis TaxID=2816852 RepID=A0ABS8ES17_9FLAO|nr:hypothetical protein [Winogradskyella immobilis]MCC1485662.1 hypothetical protein [Winogradskyella immobilis]MCG0017755.1 hypothetical protein [Winogradskyella immobilis]